MLVTPGYYRVDYLVILQDFRHKSRFRGPRTAGVTKGIWGGSYQMQFSSFYASSDLFWYDVMIKIIMMMCREMDLYFQEFAWIVGVSRVVAPSTISVHNHGNIHQHAI
jgi:hypothetical protein